MDVKPGYKQTDVGDIPEEWDVSPLGDLSQTSSGTTPARALQDRYYKNGTIGWVKTLDLRNTELLATSECVTELAFKETSLRIYPGGTVLVAMYGGFQQIGRTGLLRIPAAVNQAITAIQPKGETLSSEFLLATLNYRVGYWKNVASSSRKDPNISSQKIRNFPIASPPLTEQRAIATAFSDVDGLLGGLDRLIAKKRDLKQAAMQQLLTGQTRLPGFHGEWEMSSVGREFEIKLGKMLDAEKNVGVPKPYLGNSAVQWDRIDVSDLPTVRLSRSDIERFRLRKGDLLVCEGGEVGRAAIWEAPIDECYYQKALHRLRPLRGYTSRLMAALLRLWSDKGLLANYVTQTSIAHLPREKFVQVPLPVPTLPEQSAIAEVLTEMDEELTGLEQRREKTGALKQAMMQELLTGRTRLV